MSDELTTVVGIGGGLLGSGGIIFSLLKWSASRNIDALDKSIATFGHAMNESVKELGASISKLTEEVQKLREAHIGLAKDVGALQEGYRSMSARIDGQGSFYHKQFEEHRALVHERLNKATHDMLATVEQIADRMVDNKKRGQR